jgi:hypothetical protein
LETQRNPKKPKKADTDTDTVTDISIGIRGTKRNRFSPPTPEIALSIYRKKRMHQHPLFISFILILCT